MYYRGIFFRYAGGKHHLIKKILPLIPPHKIYVEVFGGSAELLFRKPKSKIEVYNDIDGSLVNLFEVVRNRFPEFMEKAQWLLYSRQLYTMFAKNERIDDPVERAVRTFYLYDASFGGMKSSSWGFGRSLPLPTIFFNKLKKLNKIHKRLQKVYIDCLDFRRCIKNWDSPETFFFMDPPYRGVTQANKICFTDKDYEDLAEICKHIRGKFLITLNDNPWFEALFSQFRIVKETTQLSSKKPVGQKREYYTHLLIMNYEL